MNKICLNCGDTFKFDNKRKYCCVVCREGYSRRSVYRWGKIREGIIKKYNNICQYCGKKITKNKDLCVDHIKAKSKKGQDCKDNLILSCRICNSIKSDKTFKNHNEAKKYIIQRKKRLDIQ